MPLRLFAIALLFVALTGARAQHPEVRIVFVVNSANGTSTLEREQVSQIFMRQMVTWTGGTEILPVDQIDRTPAHITFVRQVMRQSESAIKRYWQERIFTGNESPPPDRVTDSDVLTYVRSNAGAIGYVTEGTDLGAGVKVMAIR
jgi:ABC-type phosphate transport system substrate-binding protein